MSSSILAALSRYNLYLASWGYCTDEERAAAARLPGVRLLTLPQFCELLRWGVVMGVSCAWVRALGGGVGSIRRRLAGWLGCVGSPECTPQPGFPAGALPSLSQVDDGCEPTEDEVEAGVRS